MWGLSPHLTQQVCPDVSSLSVNSEDASEAGPERGHRGPVSVQEVIVILQPFGQDVERDDSPAPLPNLKSRRRTWKRTWWIIIAVLQPPAVLFLFFRRWISESFWRIASKTQQRRAGKAVPAHRRALVPGSDCDPSPLVVAWQPEGRGSPSTLVAGSSGPP